MGYCYSLDLRVRVADFVAGHSCRAAARHFGVSDSFAIKLVRRMRHSGSPAPARQGRPPGRGKLVRHSRSLYDMLRVHISPQPSTCQICAVRTSPRALQHPA